MRSGFIAPLCVAVAILVMLVAALVVVQVPGTGAAGTV